ncbi:MAG TPA: futalosine hydrolase [Actinobacteria bacterium]|nr:futalosine hydrolase [Actinomycetota bacterium]
MPYMHLIASPTELEICKLKEDKKLSETFCFLTTGFGMLESTLSLAEFLEKQKIEGVILFGVGGAYTDTGIDILDVCIAEKEFLGDFGVAFGDEIKYFENNLLNKKRDFDLKNDFFNDIKNKFIAHRIPYKSGNFVTVNSCTGTLKRGIFLQNKFNAICENMEGAAIAKVCEFYCVPLVEIRCVSNIVENRDESKWKTEEAINKGSEILTKILPKVIK